MKKQYRESNCYKCKARVVFNIPVLSREFKAYTAKCECGHEMTTFKLRDPDRQAELDEAVRLTAETLKGER